MHSLPGIAACGLAFPGRVLFGWGQRSELPKAAQELGQRAFVVLGSRTLQASSHWAILKDDLIRQRIEVCELPLVTREPLVDDVDRAVHLLRDAHAGPGDLVIGIGGGAALDMAKAVAGLSLQPEFSTVRHYLEGVGTGQTLRLPVLPWIALPTTGGTGSEATRNAVISHPQPAFKKSLRSDLLFARVVLIDPEWQTMLPRSTTIDSGLDAFTQCVESYITAKANPFTSQLAIDGARRVWNALPIAVRKPSDRAARENLAWGAFLSGMALANSGLGIAHGVAAGLGAAYGIGHGRACALMLPTAIQVNREIASGRLAKLARTLAVCDDSEPDQIACDRLLAAVEQRLREFEIPQRLSEIGATAADLDRLVELSQGNSLNGNPRPISREELRQILESML